MPRVLPLPEQQKDREIVKLISNYQIERGMRGPDKLSKILRCSKATVWRRLQNPGSITLEELRNIKSSFNIPSDVMAEFISRAI